MAQQNAQELFQKYEEQIKQKLIEVATNRGFEPPKQINMLAMLDEILSVMSEDQGIDLLIDRIEDSVGMEEYGFTEV